MSLPLPSNLSRSGPHLHFTTLAYVLSFKVDRNFLKNVAYGVALGCLVSLVIRCHQLISGVRCYLG